MRCRRRDKDCKTARRFAGKVGVPMRGGRGGETVQGLKFLLWSFRKISVLLVSDMTWAAAGVSRPLRASGPQTHRTLYEPQLLGKSNGIEGPRVGLGLSITSLKKCTHFWTIDQTTWTPSIIEVLTYPQIWSHDITGDKIVGND